MKFTKKSIFLLVLIISIISQAVLASFHYDEEIMIDPSIAKMMLRVKF
jgi:hypothetical protein